MDSVEICGGVGAFVSIIHSSHTCVRARTCVEHDRHQDACDAETRTGHGARCLPEAEGPPGRAARRSAAPAAPSAARTGPRSRRAPARADLSINLEELCTPPERVFCLLKGIAEGTYNAKHAEAAKLYYTTI